MNKMLILIMLSAVSSVDANTCLNLTGHYDISERGCLVRIAGQTSTDISINSLIINHDEG